MRTISELVVILMALGAGFAWLSTEFAAASDVEMLQSDVSEIKQMVTADAIQRRMMRYCESVNAELKLRIEANRLAYEANYGYAVEWVCDP